MSLAPSRLTCWQSRGAPLGEVMVHYAGVSTVGKLPVVDSSGEDGFQKRGTSHHALKDILDCLLFMFCQAPSYRPPRFQTQAHRSGSVLTVHPGPSLPSDWNPH